MNTKAKQKKLIFITAGTVILLIMLISLIMLVSSLVASNNREKRLRTNIEQLDYQISQNILEIEYRKLDEFVEKYAREHLGMQYPNDIIFIAK